MKTEKSRTLEAADAFNPLGKSPDFSLVAGGPFFQFLLRTPLSNDGSMRMRQIIIIVIPLLAWLPLLALSAIEGQVFPGSVAVPFLLDLEVHVRFLLALPLLLIAELTVQRRMRPLLQEFSDQNIVPKNSMARFEAAVTSAIQLRNSVLAEVLLIAFVYGVGILIIWRHYVSLDAATWYATSSDGGSKLSLAGIWYGYVSLPIFQFLLCRWYFRLFIWARFLWQVSRIKLSLVPAHPDRVAGLNILFDKTSAFTILAMAHGALLAGWLATRVVFLGDALTEFKSEIAAMAIFVLCVILGPLLVFAPQLKQTKRNGLVEFSELAARYVGDFDTKWLAGRAPDKETLIGNADIQSLADLGNSYNMVRAMRSIPITKEDVVRFGVATLVPTVPLLLTIMPLGELLKKFASILF